MQKQVCVNFFIRNLPCVFTSWEAKGSSRGLYSDEGRAGRSPNDRSVQLTIRLRHLIFAAVRARHILELTKMNVNVLALDAESYVIMDPYPLFKGQVRHTHGFANASLILTPDACALDNPNACCNGKQWPCIDTATIYVQNVKQPGVVMALLERWAANAEEAMAAGLRNDMSGLGFSWVDDIDAGRSLEAPLDDILRRLAVAQFDVNAGVDIASDEAIRVVPPAHFSTMRAGPDAWVERHIGKSGHFGKLCIAHMMSSVGDYGSKRFEMKGFGWWNPVAVMEGKQEYSPTSKFLALSPHDPTKHLNREAWKREVAQLVKIATAIGRRVIPPEVACPGRTSRGWRDGDVAIGGTHWPFKCYLNTAKVGSSPLPLANATARWEI
mmetsp:Transcript_11101/g.35232  ORF Transcript_11101/g.35232 Transcript_11101/m.35232 type:complete len:382 (-) Transcript_11101:58-1203(-)